MSNYQIPFVNGQMQHYWSTRWSNKYIDMRDNFVFEDHLYFVDVCDWAIFEDDEGYKYYMGLTEFNRVVRLMIRGGLKGKFTFVKRGRYFGIVLVEEIL